MIFKNNKNEIYDKQQIFISLFMDKQNVVYPYNGKLFSHKNEVLVHDIVWMNLENMLNEKVNHNR